MRCAPRRTSAASTALLWPPRSAPLTTSQSLKRRSNRPSAIIRADLERSGAFRGVDNSATLDEASQPVWGEWRARAADALVGGSAARLVEGRFDLRFKLWDVVKGADLGGQSNAVEAAEVRLGAHRIAD